MFSTRIFLVFFATFLSLAKSEIFECDFQLKSLENLGKVYQCQGKVLDSGRENFIESVIGFHIPKHSNNDVRSLHVIHQNMKKLPENLHRIFPNLVRIYIAHSNLISLTAHDLEHFKDLRFLDVWNNKLQSISADLLKFSPKIERISFAKNPIQSVGEDLLDGLEELQQADFRHTHCIDFRARNAHEIHELKKQLLAKCSLDVEVSDSPHDAGKITDVSAEMEELKKNFLEQSETIIFMAKEVLEHKETLKTQSENFAGLVSEATALIVQLIEVVLEQSEKIEYLEESVEDHDEVVDHFEERLAVIEERLGIKQKDEN